MSERYKNGLTYEESRTLEREMAVRAYCSDAADMMIPTRESEPRARALAKFSDDARTDEEQADPRVQDWRRREYAMGQALIALGGLGYHVVKVESQ